VQFAVSERASSYPVFIHGVAVLAVLRRVRRIGLGDGHDLLVMLMDCCFR